MSDPQSIPTWTTERRLFAAKLMQGLLANSGLSRSDRLLEQDLPLIARSAILATTALLEALEAEEAQKNYPGIPAQYMFEPVRCALRYGGSLMGLGLYEDVHLEEGDRVLLMDQGEIYIVSSHQWHRTNELVGVVIPVVIPITDGFFKNLVAIRKLDGERFEIRDPKLASLALELEGKSEPASTPQNQQDAEPPSLTQGYSDESVSADFDKIANYCLRGGIGRMINDVQQFCAYEAKERLADSDDQRLKDADYWCRLANKLREAWELTQ